MTTLSVIIPCYNEERNLKKAVLNAVTDYLDKKIKDYQLIIVDDGSTDRSQQWLTAFAKRHSRVKIIKKEHQGKANAVIAGIMAAKGNYVLFVDLDQATPISEFDKFRPWLRQGYRLVVGNRHKQRHGAPLSRLLMAWGFMFLRNLILGLKVVDTQCGFKAFERLTALKIINKLQLYGKRIKARGSLVTAGFDVEMLFIASKLGIKIKEVPVKWHYVETRRVNSLRDSWLGFVDLVKIKLNDLCGFYE